LSAGLAGASGDAALFSGDGGGTDTAAGFPTVLTVFCLLSVPDETVSLVLLQEAAITRTGSSSDLSIDIEVVIFR
jgi:hypothetical protein